MKPVNQFMSATRKAGLHRSALALLAVAIGVVVLTACSSPTTQGQPKGEATSSEQTSTEQGASSADQNPVSTTEHDNFVQFNGDACITSASFAPQDSNITGGQPWGGVSTSTPYVANGTLELDVQAGRKDSSGPAAWFNQQAPVYISAGRPATIKINNLNFAVTGELTLNGDTYLIALGQGNVGGGSSPWWLGGKGGFFQESGQLIDKLITPDRKYAFEADWNSKLYNNGFQMTCNVTSSAEGNS